MKRFLRLLSIVLLISNSCSFISAGGDIEEASTSVFKGIPDEYFTEIVNSGIDLEHDIGFEAEQERQRSEREFARAVKKSQEPTGKGLYGPTKEETIIKAQPLSGPLLETCYKTASEDIKDVILALRNRDLATDTNTPTAILLYGPHGTGKSTIAQLLAQKSEPSMDCWIVHAGGLLNSYKNGAEETLRKSLAPLEQIIDQQCVVLIDEVDALTDGHDNEKDSNRSVAVTMAKILDTVQGKKNILLVLATNNFDKVPEIVHDRLELNYYKIDLPGQAQRKAAIDYRFKNLEKTEFKCENSTFKVRFLNIFRNAKTQEESNEEFQQQLSDWLGGCSYRNIRDLFTVARKVAFKRAVENDESIVTITREDFEKALSIIKAKKEELKLGIWSRTKKFYKENPVLAGSLTTAAGVLIHHYWEYLPQLKLQEAHAEQQSKLTALSIWIANNKSNFTYTLFSGPSTNIWGKVTEDETSTAIRHILSNIKDLPK